jgi:hypothetical protein
MKKHITLIFFALIVALSGHAQIRISYSVGYGTYKMDDMHKLLDASLSSIQIQLPPGVGITDKFPGYITHSLDATYYLKRHELGVKGTYMTTGGKVAYSDYSGKYYEKLTLNGFRVGALYRFYFLKTHIGTLPFSLYGEVSPAITFTSLKYKALLSLPKYEISESNEEDPISTKEMGYSVQPLIGGQLFLTHNIFFSLSAGYDFEFGSKLSTTNNMLRADWTGLRVNIGVGYSF